MICFVCEDTRTGNYSAKAPGFFLMKRQVNTKIVWTTLFSFLPLIWVFSTSIHNAYIYS